MTDGLRLRRAGPEDTDALCGLIGAVFPDNPKADPAVLRWQFWGNPAGQAVSWVAEDVEGLVSHFAVLPVPGRLDGTPTRLAKPADAATLPRAQGRGLMGRLARHVFADCADEGIPVTMCLPNFRARGALLKVGLQVVGRLRVHVRPLDDGFLRRRFHLPRPVAAGIRRTVFGAPLPGGAMPVTEPPDDLDDLVHRLAEPGGTGVVHDTTWWRWRYLEAPLDYDFVEFRRDGRLVGVAVTRLREAYGGTFLSVLDLLATDPDAARHLVGTAVEANPGADGLATLAVPGTRLAEQATACGMRPLPERLEPQPAILGWIDNAGTRSAPPQGWTVSWCDLDHV